MGEKRIEKINAGGTIESSRPLALYPFVPGKYGLDLMERTTPFTGMIKTGSGRKVRIDIGETGDRAWANADDLDDIGYLMHVEVQGDAAKASVYTQKKTGEKHPDFFAKNFLAFAVNHFKNQGHPVRRFHAYWTSLTNSAQWTSDNYDEYWRLRKEGMEPADAARNTWTGKMLTELGFSKIGDINEDRREEEVRVEFKIF